jgi:hypothetical protein
MSDHHPKDGITERRNVQHPYMSDHQSYKVVVARYNENVDWLRMFNRKSVIIYNKGRPLPEYPIEVIQLENKGLESATYLRYVIDNYDKLPDIVFFTQGRINDHVREMSRDYIFRRYIEIDKFSKSFYNGRINDGFTDNRLRVWNGELADAGMDVVQFFNEYVNTNKDEIDLYNNFKIYAAAIFSVSRDLIRSRPKEYYERLYNLDALKHQRPEVAHFFERSWFYIFNCHKA